MRPSALHIAGFGVLIALACGDGNGTASDAAVARDGMEPAEDARANPDGIAPLTWVDFTITGCVSGTGELETADPDAGVDAGVPDPCTGVAPLSLTFAAVSPAQIEVYLWTFGDGEEAATATPVHVYQAPGEYRVSLVVGGPGGTASVTKPRVVVVEAAGLGGPCAQDAQCAGELDCVCDDATTCPPGLAGGLCSTGCAAGNQCEEGVCANLAPAAVTVAADWQRALCLVECDEDDDCPDALVCRELRNGYGSGWIGACFVHGLLSAIGESCADADGALVGALCASGTCIAEGARGMCSDPCTAGSCPGSAACATFTDGDAGSWCVSRCETVADCTADPWLACQAPGAVGDKSFTVDEAPAPLGYCAPKACTEPGECGLDGDCVSGYCGPAA